MTFPVLNVDFVVPTQVLITAAPLTSEAYLASRHRDSITLGYEIAECRMSGEADLGYCSILSGNRLLIKGKVHAFKSYADVCAYILRTFW